MIKKAFFLLLVIIFTGCRSQKPLISEVSEKIELEELQSDMELLASEKSKESVLGLNNEHLLIKGNSHFTGLLFDTQKPADPLTGIPPLKAVFFMENQNSVQKESYENNQKEIHNTINTALSGQSTSQLVRTDNSQIVEKPTRYPNRFRYILYTVGCILIGMIVFLFRKKWKKIIGEYFPPI